jgi:hypothetical protein
MTSEVEKNLRLLGLKARDVVTGFTGIVSTINFDLYGCVQAVLTPEAKDGKPLDGGWFDTKRLTVLSSDRVMPLPLFIEIPGPAIKPAMQSDPSRR